MSRREKKKKKNDLKTFNKYSYKFYSEEMYGSLFEKATQKLTTLFRKTNEVQKLFYTLLERVIVFSKDLESELLSLAKGKFFPLF